MIEERGWNLVNGERRDGPRAEVVRNPARLSAAVGTVGLADSSLVDEAVRSASRAQADWGSSSLADRQKAVLQGRAALAGASEEGQWARLLTAEQGKIDVESSMEILLGQMLIEQFVQDADAALGPDVLDDELGRRVVTRDPIGVVGAITPWNYPVVLSLIKVIPALLAGNAVVLKPAPNTPFTVSLAMETIGSALPPGVLNVVHGAADVGEALCTHPQVAKVSFTGSVPTGRRVMAAVAPGMKRITLELGGNDAAIVLDDVALDDAAIARMTDAIFMTTGQVCMAIKRLYVHRSRFDEVVGALCEAANSFVVGDGMEPDVTMGPLNNQAQYDKVRSFIFDAERRGGAVNILGARSAASDWSDGYFMRPRIVTAVDDSAPLVVEEQFGPVVPVLPFDDDEDALRRANDTEYGLCGSVWSTDTDRAFALSARLQAGQVFVNAHGLMALDLTCSAGGVKQSGLGRECGIDGLRAYTESRYVTNRRAM
jgi:acyl-CoA reductase-like NAD-dependent aldehyde dehydrogenase